MTKLDADTRKAQILSASLDVAKRVGLSCMTQRQIAKQAGVSVALPIYYFGTMSKLRREVMKEAVRKRELKIIAQGLAERNTVARNADPELQREALATLTD